MLLRLQTVEVMILWQYNKRIKMTEQTRFKEKLRKKLLSIKPDFNEHDLETGIERFKLFEGKAGDLIVKKGERCDTIFLAEKSISRCFVWDENYEEKTIWIEPEMSFLTEFKSFKSGEKSGANIHLYEDSLVYLIEREQLFNLYESYHEWALLGILFLEEFLHYTMAFSHQMHFNNATQNYKLIEEKYLRYLNIVPLKHIASRLNISPVHLSRIRNKAGENSKN